MNQPRYLTSEEADEEIILSDDDKDSESDESVNGFLLGSDSDSDGSDDSSSQIRNQNYGNQSYVSKDGVSWNPLPIHMQAGGKYRMKNVNSLCPGVTTFAERRVDNIKDSFMLFFPPPIEKMILKHTNAYVEASGKTPIITIDANLLYAYIGVLLLAGVYR